MSNHAELIRQENDGLPVANRGRRFIEFDLGGGKRRHVATIEPLHTRTTGDEVDTSWVASTNPAWQWQLAQCDFQAHARSVFNVGNLIEWRHESDEWVIVDPQSINWINQDGSREQIAIKQAVTGVPDDMTLRFPNAYGAGRHFEYTAHPKRLIKHFILDQPLPDPAPWLTGTIHFEVEWTISNSAGVELYLDGVKWARTDNVRVRTSNRIEFKTADDADPLWYADAPVATDANGETVTAQYEVMRQGGGYFIRVRVPREWLLTAAYPVQVDPTFTDGYGGDVDTAFDTYVNTNFRDQDYGSNGAMSIGRTLVPVGEPDYDCKHGKIKFTLTDLEDVTVDSATIYFYVAQSYRPWGDLTLEAHRILSANSGWLETCTWNYAQPPSVRWAGDSGSDGGDDAGGNQIGTDFATDAMGTLVITDKSWVLGDEQAISLSDLTEFDNMVAGNHGLVLYGAHRDNLVCTSDHATTGYRPKLVVEYTEAAGGDALEFVLRPKIISSPRPIHHLQL